jgi:hypothetical protein
MQNFTTAATCRADDRAPPPRPPPPAAAPSSCLPFSVLVVPSNTTLPPGAEAPPGAAARISFTAERAVLNATNATVAGGVLALNLVQAFETSQVRRAAGAAAPRGACAPWPPAPWAASTAAFAGCGSRVIGRTARFSPIARARAQRFHATDAPPAAADPPDRHSCARPPRHLRRRPGVW